jgi:hypothetical protein
MEMFDNMFEPENLKRVPEVGEELHFFDDGKMSQSRHYIATVVRVVRYEDSMGIVVPMREWSFDGSDSWLTDTNLVDIYDIEKHNADWLYAEMTDYFIEISVPEYDENNLWCVRTKDGGWFSMDIQSGWQAGRLDTDGSIYQSFLEMHDGYDYRKDKRKKK